MTAADMNARIVRYGDLVPCRTAFTDAQTPGSDRKKGFTTIGGRLSENPGQHVHMSKATGFNIGAAVQPPKCRIALHAQWTAEVCF